MNGLERFQEYGDARGLLEFVRGTGNSAARYESALAELAPVFEGLTHGEAPIFERLDRDHLRLFEPEVEQIVQWMSASSKANIQTSAIGLMGFLGYESFLAPLERYLLSNVKWQRLTAITALASIPGERAAGLLRMAARDPDPDIRAEVVRATKGT